MLGPSCCLLEHAANAWSDRQGHPEDGKTDLALALRSGNGIHQSNLG